MKCKNCGIELKKDTWKVSLNDGVYCGDRNCWEIGKLLQDMRLDREITAERVRYNPFKITHYH